MYASPVPWVIRPRIILLDEAISSLDASTQVQIMDLLIELRRNLGLLLFITHDLTSITYLCDRVVFIDAGTIVEQVDDIRRIAMIRNDYARNLLGSVMGIGVEHGSGGCPHRAGSLRGHCLRRIDSCPRFLPQAAALSAPSRREYAAMLLPFILSTVTQPLIGAVDTAVMGRLSDPSYIAGVAVGAVIFNTLYWLLGFLRVAPRGSARRPWPQGMRRPPGRHSFAGHHGPAAGHVHPVVPGCRLFRCHVPVAP